jgi:hypothetical protein
VASHFSGLFRPRIVSLSSIVCPTARCLPSPAGGPPALLRPCPVLLGSLGWLDPAGGWSCCRPSPWRPDPFRWAHELLKTASLAWSSAVSLPSPSSFFSMSPSTSGRQIIQITAVPQNHNVNGVQSKGGLFALCDDGTVWYLDVKTISNAIHPQNGKFVDVEWREVPSIPPLP